MFVLSADSLADESQIEVELKSDSSLGSSYADPLFAGAMPTSANWEKNRRSATILLVCMGRSSMPEKRRLRRP